MVHHAQAVEMSEIVRDKTENEEVSTLSTDIVLTQQAQIGIMQGWLQAWGLPIAGTEPAMAWMGHPIEGRMPGIATPQEINRLKNAPPEEADAMFLRLMITQHRAAIPMAEAVLEQTDRREVEQFARAIAASQKSEIKLMQGMLEEMGEEAPTEDHPTAWSPCRAWSTEATSRSDALQGDYRKRWGSKLKRSMWGRQRGDTLAYHVT